MKKEENDQLTRRPSRMELNHMATPYEAFEQYFDSFSLDDCRSHLWTLYERSVLSYTRELTHQENAMSTLYFYTQTEMMVEAAWLINQNRLRRKEKAMERTIDVE
jgi:hypothetical protein